MFEARLHLDSIRRIALLELDNTPQEDTSR